MSDAKSSPGSEAEVGRKPFSLWRRLAWVAAISFVVLLAVGVAMVAFDQSLAARRSRDDAALLDATDPRWRLEEIEDARVKPPAGENSAVLCKELARMLGRGWPDQAFDEAMGKATRPPEVLEAERMKQLEAEMVRLEPIRTYARPLADMPMGRYEMHYAFNPMATLLQDQQETRKVANLFRYEMVYLANKGDVTGAVRSGRAGVCAGRAMYDEPLLISQLVRIAIITLSLNGVEGALSLGEAKAGELEALQKLLEDEEKHNTLLVGVRGERALMDQLFTRIVSGAIPPNEVTGMMGTGGESWLTQLTVTPRWQFRRQHPIMMEMMNRAVENARLPAAEQAAAEKELDAKARELRLTAPLVGMLVPATQKVAEACRRKTAQVAAMRALLAVERYRLKHGRWPAKLGDVVGEFLKRVPTDPYDGKPLKMVRTADGLVVYSVGPDGKDDGGKIDRDRPLTPGTDMGYRLWDVAARRRPAGPVAPPE